MQKNGCFCCYETRKFMQGNYSVRIPYSESEVLIIYLHPGY